MDYTNVSELISVNASKTPDKKHIFHFNTTYSYAQTDKIVSRAANILAANGVKKGDRVAMLVNNCPEYIFAFFAIVRLGAVAVPLNFFLRDKEIAINLNDCEADYIVSISAFENVVPQVMKAVSSLKKCFSFGETPFLSIDLYDESYSPDFKDADITPDDLLMLIYTSGTTGKPKGVMLTHKNLLTNGYQFKKAVEADEKDICVAILPLFHAYAFLTCVVGPFFCSGGVLIFSSIHNVTQEDFRIFIAKYRPTILLGVPQLFSALARKQLNLEEQKIMPFRAYISGGAPLPFDTIDKFKESYGRNVVEGYGLSEASPLAAVNPIDNPKAGSIGKIVADMEFKIIDDNGKELGPNERGEFVIRGGNVMKGYWNQPEETAKVLTADGWLHTGDVATFDEEGYIFIVDRIKDLIISKGLNIYPREIEEHLYKHSAVEHAAVIGIPDKDGSEIVVAYIQLAEGKTATEREIRDYVKKNLANFKVPKRVVFIDNIPVNASGKVLKRELRELTGLQR